MVIPAEWIVEIRRGRRSQFRLPVTRHGRGGWSAERRCPVIPGHAYTLQPQPGIKGSLRVTVLDVRREMLHTLTEDDARREGFYGVPGCLRSWEAHFGAPLIDREVWVVSVIRGDHTALTMSGQDLYLAARSNSGECRGDYTTRRDQAIPGEPAVLDPEARGRHAKQLAEQRQRALDLITEIKGYPIGANATRRIRQAERHIREIGAEAA